VGEGAKGFFVSGPYPLPQSPTPNPVSFGGTGVRRGGEISQGPGYFELLVRMNYP
jgi:hypothetical protein